MTICFQVSMKEVEFLQKLMPGLYFLSLTKLRPGLSFDFFPPGYYMNLQQNPRTLLPKFFGMFTYQVGNTFYDPDASTTFSCYLQDDAVEHMVLLNIFG